MLLQAPIIQWKESQDDLKYILIFVGSLLMLDLPQLKVLILVLMLDLLQLSVSMLVLMLDLLQLTVLILVLMLDLQQLKVLMLALILVLNLVLNFAPMLDI